MYPIRDMEDSLIIKILKKLYVEITHCMFGTLLWPCYSISLILQRAIYLPFRVTVDRYTFNSTKL